MQITLEADYAVRCMVYLKNNYGKVSVLGDISRGTRIPPAFLSKILQKMVRRGLVGSLKGKKGGFYLAQKPERVSVYDILRAVCAGGAVFKVVCDKSGRPCVLRKTCRIHVVWEELERTARALLQSRNLSSF